MSALAQVIPFPGRKRGKVLTFPPPRPTGYTSPRDLELPAAVHAATAAGHITGLTDAHIQRALVCSNDEIGLARVAAVLAMAYEYGWHNPDGAHVMALALLEICPNLEPTLLAQLFKLTARAQTRHEVGQRDAETAVVIAHMRVIAAQLAGVSPLDDDPDGAA